MNKKTAWPGREFYVAVHLVTAGVKGTVNSAKKLAYCLRFICLFRRLTQNRPVFYNTGSSTGGLPDACFQTQENRRQLGDQVLHWGELRSPEPP
jgi:hypothetical protein